MNPIQIFSILTSILIGMSGCSPKQPCDLLVHNAVVHTIDAENTIVEAIAVRNGEILGLGSSGELLELFDAAAIVDLDGRHVFPGFIDAHAHLCGLGEMETILALQGTTSKDEVLDRVAARLLSVSDRRQGPERQQFPERQLDTQWLRGRGWDQNDWPEKVFPHRRDLDLVTTDVPVYLSRIDGHAVWVNSAALELAGITASTPDPDGGRILRDAGGEATGILLDNAVELVRTIVPPPDREYLRLMITAAIKRCLSVGLTGMHDMGMKPEYESCIAELISENSFPFRVAGYVDGTGDYWEHLLDKGRYSIGNQQLTIVGLKLYADGALGSRGALLLENYSDDPGNRGISLTSETSLRLQTSRALEAGLQVAVHAIGDSAGRLVLNAYEHALASSDGATYPLRIEHVQVLASHDIQRFEHPDIIPSMQPTHCTSDMYWAEARLGSDRIRGAYAWRSLLSSSGWIPCGSDFPVESPDPLAGIYAATFRKDAKGKPAGEQDVRDHFLTDVSQPELAARYEDGWFGEEKMSRLEAIRSFTIWAAKAAGMDDRLGSLEVGKFADFTVLTQDITTISRNRFLDTRVVQTFHAGEIVYRNDYLP